MTERTVLADDLDGALEATRCAFTWEGVPYEVDLAGDNLAMFKQWQALASRWVEVGRTVAATPAPKRSRTIGVFPDPPNYDRADLRRWAADEGLSVARAGRIPRAIVERYMAARAATVVTNGHA